MMAHFKRFHTYWIAALLGVALPLCGVLDSTPPPSIGD